MTTMTMKIPDDLMAWGRDPEREAHWPRPWAREVEEILRTIGDHVPNERMLLRLLARLEALCAEAARAGRGDLLAGFDLGTAEMLGLTFGFDVDGKRVEIGKRGRYSWGEMRSLLATDDPKDALRSMDRAKDMLANVFGDVRVEVSDTSAQPPVVCASCGRGTSCVMMLSESGARYCGHCWLDLTNDTPVDLKPARKSSRGDEKGEELPFAGVRR